MQNEFSLPYENMPSLRRPEGRLAILYDQLTSPKKAVQALSERRPYGLAFFVIALSVLSRVTAGLISPSCAGTFGGVSLFVLLCMGQLIITLVFIVIAASVYHFAATNEDKLGDVRVLFLLIAVCFLPDIFLAPVAILTNGLPFGAGMAVFAGVGVGLWVWIFVLQIVAVKNYYEISGGRSFLAVILPFILMGVLVFGFFLMVFAYIMISMKNILG